MKDENPFQCKTCDKCFKDSSNLKIHERIHTGEKPFHCKGCPKSFSYSSNLKRYEAIHSEEKPFK